MGLFKFIKDAGAKLFGGSAKAEEISTAVKGTGLDPSTVTFDKTGDTVKLSGAVMSQEEADGLMHAAHQVCPYSHATRNNIEVKLSASTEAKAS